MSRMASVFGLAISLFLIAAQTEAKEKLRVASEGYFPPFNDLDQNGKLIGFDIDIGNALCEKLKMECEFVQVSWDELIPGLVKGNYDAIIASMSITEERSKVVSFTIPYYSNMLTFIGRK